MSLLQQVVGKVRELILLFLAQATEEASSTLLSASSPCPSYDLPPRQPFGLSPPFSPCSPVLSLPPFPAALHSPRPVGHPHVAPLSPTFSGIRNLAPQGRAGVPCPLIMLALLG